ncbi:MAG: methyltransferase [Methylocystaceae bacterium]|nr:MAG: methyltransferase [Methylocystaceae bacterium]
MDVCPATNAPPDAEAERADGFLGGRLRLRQTPRGHRAGTDAVLLAAATPADAEGTILDVGAGVGAVGLGAALRAPAAQIGLVEIDAAACSLARANVAANAFEARVAVFEADLLSPPARRAAGLADEAADLLLTNPPYLSADRARVSPDPDRARAHVSENGLAPWTRACLALLRPGGVFVMIHRADALQECLTSLGAKLGGVAILPVAARAGGPATRILLRGVKGSKAPLTLLPQFALHEEDGRFTAEAQAIHRGEAGLPW